MDECQWRKDCPKLKACKREMSWNGQPPTQGERAAAAAKERARLNRSRVYRKAHLHARKLLPPVGGSDTMPA